MACGVPVAAYPGSGLADVVINGWPGYFDEDLSRDIVGALELDPSYCVEYAQAH